MSTTLQDLEVRIQEVSNAVDKLHCQLFARLDAMERSIARSLAHLRDDLNNERQVRRAVDLDVYNRLERLESARREEEARRG